jgi:hypothetical protein
MMSDRSMLHACALEADQTVVGFDSEGYPIYAVHGSPEWVRAYNSAKSEILQDA